MAKEWTEQEQQNLIEFAKRCGWVEREIEAFVAGYSLGYEAHRQLSEEPKKE